MRILQCQVGNGGNYLIVSPIKDSQQFYPIYFSHDAGARGRRSSGLCVSLQPAAYHEASSAGSTE
jgi:hypothetical protein